MQLELVSWNCNGLRSVMKKGAFQSMISDLDPDIVCLQETRCPEDTVMEGLPDLFPFHTICAHARPGYAGVAIISKVPHELLSLPATLAGRCICAEFSAFYLINIYVPNSKADLSALEERTTVWEPEIRGLISGLGVAKPVIVVGDFNVSPTNIDIYMKKSSKTHGATPVERADFQKLLGECNLADTYRELNKEKREWTWFSNFGNARARNNGWRIDIALISRRFMKYVASSEILGHITGSDHVPVRVTLKSTSSSSDISTI